MSIIERINAVFSNDDNIERWNIMLLKSECFAHLTLESIPSDSCFSTFFTDSNANSGMPKLVRAGKHGDMRCDSFNGRIIENRLEVRGS